MPHGDAGSWGLGPPESPSHTPRSRLPFALLLCLVIVIVGQRSCPRPISCPAPAPLTTRPPQALSSPHPAAPGLGAPDLPPYQTNTTATMNRPPFKPAPSPPCHAWPRPPPPPPRPTPAPAPAPPPPCPPTPAPHPAGLPVGPERSGRPAVQPGHLPLHGAAPHGLHARLVRAAGLPLGLRSRQQRPGAAPGGRVRLVRHVRRRGGGWGGGEACTCVRVCARVSMCARTCTCACACAGRRAAAACNAV